MGHIAIDTSGLRVSLTLCSVPFLTCRSGPVRGGQFHSRYTTYKSSAIERRWQVRQGSMVTYPLSSSSPWHRKHFKHCLFMSPFDASTHGACGCESNIITRRTSRSNRTIIGKRGHLTPGRRLWTWRKTAHASKLRILLLYGQRIGEC